MYVSCIFNMNFRSIFGIKWVYLRLNKVISWVYHMDIWVISCEYLENLNRGGLTVHTLSMSTCISLANILMKAFFLNNSDKEKTLNALDLKKSFPINLHIV